MRLTKADKTLIIEKIIDDIPQQDYRQQAYNLLISESKKLIPTHIQALLETQDADRFDTRFESFSVEYPYMVSANIRGLHKMDGRIPDKTAKEITKLLELWKDQDQTLSKVRKELEAAFKGIPTLKKAKDIFPEFEKYFPVPDDSPKYLPVHTSVVISLMDAGWPKNKLKRPKKTA